MFSWIEEYIRAGSPKASSKELALLARSVHPKVRLRVAENPNTPKEILSFLSKDPDAEVRVAVGTASNTPINITQKLVHDSDPTVRHGIAEDIHTRSELLLVLAQDENAYVSCRAKKTLDILLRGGDKASTPHRNYLFSTTDEQCYA